MKTQKILLGVLFVCTSCMLANVLQSTLMTSGHCKLDGNVARICKSLRLKVQRLRETTATRFFQPRVNEQLIMERTGHHSTDGNRVYKRTVVSNKRTLQIL